MNNFLKQYHVVLRTVGPVFIGSGREISKKEYLFLGKDKVAIPDIQKLYLSLKKKGKATVFEEYMLSNGRMDLGGWLRSQQIKVSDIRSAMKYELDCGDAVIEKGRTIQMLECIKNPYGEPYVPGTSLKGMFRTILLSNDIMENPYKYQSELTSMEKEVFTANDFQKTNRNTLLKSNVGNIEAINYRILGRDETKTTDAVNDIMQGFIVSDSEPFSAKDLVLCQKVERHKDSTEKTLPILRECIKPGVEIRFTITVDTSVCNYDSKIILAATKNVITNYYKSFQKQFKDLDLPKTNYLYLGGGSGFVSKTIVYPLYKDDRRKGVEFTQKIFDKTKVPRIHKHYKDKELGVSPHILKCTRYQGKTMQMGLCKIEKIVCNKEKDEAMNKN